MSLIAKDNSGPSFEPLSAGMHHAVCYAVIDIGTQPQMPNSNYPSRRKVLFMWEVPGERIEVVKDGVRSNLPRAVSARYTLSLASKGNLLPLLVSWRGRAFTAEELAGFDVAHVAGANCLLNIVHKQGTGEKANRTYAEVASVNPALKGQPKLKPENPITVFSMQDGTGPVIIPPTIPEWIETLIKQSDEFNARLRPGAEEQADREANVDESQAGDGEDVPF